MTKELEIKIAVVETQLENIDLRLEKVEKKQEWIFYAICGAIIAQVIGMYFN